MTTLLFADLAINRTGYNLSGIWVFKIISLFLKKLSLTSLTCHPELVSGSHEMPKQVRHDKLKEKSTQKMRAVRVLSSPRSCSHTQRQECYPFRARPSISIYTKGRKIQDNFSPSSCCHSILKLFSGRIRP